MRELIDTRITQDVGDRLIEMLGGVTFSENFVTGDLRFSGTTSPSVQMLGADALDYVKAVLPSVAEAGQGLISSIQASRAEEQLKAEDAEKLKSLKTVDQAAVDAISKAKIEASNAADLSAKAPNSVSAKQAADRAQAAQSIAANTVNSADATASGLSEGGVKQRVGFIQAIANTALQAQLAATDGRAVSDAKAKASAAQDYLSHVQMGSPLFAGSVAPFVTAQDSKKSEKPAGFLNTKYGFMTGGGWLAVTFAVLAATTVGVVLVKRSNRPFGG